MASHMTIIILMLKPSHSRLVGALQADFRASRCASLIPGAPACFPAWEELEP